MEHNKTTMKEEVFTWKKNKYRHEQMSFIAQMVFEKNTVKRPIVNFIEAEGGRGITADKVYKHIRKAVERPKTKPIERGLVSGHMSAMCVKGFLKKVGHGNGATYHFTEKYYQTRILLERYSLFIANEVSVKEDGID